MNCSTRGSIKQESILSRRVQQEHEDCTSPQNTPSSPVVSLIINLQQQTAQETGKGLSIKASSSASDSGCRIHDLMKPIWHNALRGPPLLLLPASPLPNTKSHQCQWVSWCNEKGAFYISSSASAGSVSLPVSQCRQLISHTTRRDGAGRGEQ